jgi:hypothetical protein
VRLTKNKYASLPKTSVASFETGGSPLVLHFKLADWRLQKIDLQFFMEGAFPRSQLGKVCVEVFWLEMQYCAPETRKCTRRALKDFNNFLDWRAAGGPELQISSTLELSTTLLIEYQTYLEAVCTIQENSAKSIYTRLISFLRHLRVHRPEDISPNFRLPGCRFKYHRSSAIAGGVISVNDLKRIADAALKEVRQIREDHRRAINLLESAASQAGKVGSRRKPKGYWKSLANFMHALVKEEGIASRIPVPYGQLAIIHCHPSPMKLIGWYAPTSVNYFTPFLILLLIRTAINVSSIYTLKRDCLKEHPLPLGLTILRFSKPRAAAHSDKELSLPTHQANGAIDLIQFLLTYTQPWVEFASDAEKDSLFLYKSPFMGVRSPISYAEICEVELDRFIARHKLPAFSFNQLRPTIATLLYLQTRDIFRVQRLLDHSSVRTTINYIRGPVVEAQHNRQMSEGIDRMIDSLTGIEYPRNGLSVFIDPVATVIAEKVQSKELSPEAGERFLSGACNTLIGKCQDPLNSPQPGEVKGRVCRSLHACLFCENCWIFAEDLPATIQYRDRLLSEKKEMTDEAWEMLHGAAVRAIDHSILSAFPTAVVKQAELSAKQDPMLMPPAHWRITEMRRAILASPLAVSSQLSPNEHSPVSAVSVFSDETWDFSAEIADTSKPFSKRAIQWKFELTQERDSPALYASMLLALKQLAYLMLFGVPQMKPISVIDRIMLLKIFIRFLAERQSPIFRFQDVLEFHIKEYINNLKTRPGRRGVIHSSVLSHHLAAINLLHDYRDQLSDYLSFRPTGDRPPSKIAGYRYAEAWENRTQPSPTRN